MIDLLARPLFRQFRCSRLLAAGVVCRMRQSSKVPGQVLRACFRISRRCKTLHWTANEDRGHPRQRRRPSRSDADHHGFAACSPFFGTEKASQLRKGKRTRTVAVAVRSGRRWNPPTESQVGERAAECAQRAPASPVLTPPRGVLVAAIAYRVGKGGSLLVWPSGACPPSTAPAIRRFVRLSV